MPTTAATVVGNKFVFEYYTTLSQKPEEIVTFYKAESTLTSGYGSFEMNASNEQEVEIVHGAQNIALKNKLIGFKGANVVVSSINCQESLNGGVMVSVLGTIQTKRENGEMNAARAFQQVFYLGVQSEPAYSYFVLNDIFLFVNTSVSPSPKASPIIASHSPFTVSAVPKEPVQHHVVEHSPIPAPQTTAAPVSLVVEPPKSVPIQHQPIPEAVVSPAPSKSAESQVVATTTSSTSSQGKPEKPKKSRDYKKSGSNTAQPATTGSPATTGNSGDFIIKKSSKEPKAPRPKKEREPGTSSSSEGEKKPAKTGNNRQNGQKKHDKKAENQEKVVEKATSNGNSVTSPKSNSWASVAFVPDEKPVFAPPAIVYEAPIVKVDETKPEKKKEKEQPIEKPKKVRELKKENPEEVAMKRTRELRSIRVGNLPYEVEEKAVIDLFKQFGDIKEVMIKKGFGYIEFHTVTGVTNSLNHVKKNDLEISDSKNNKPRRLIVEQRKPKISAEPDKPFYKEEKKKEQQATTTTTTTTTPSS